MPSVDMLAVIVLLLGGMPGLIYSYPTYWARDNACKHPSGDLWPHGNVTKDPSYVVTVTRSDDTTATFVCPGAFYNVFVNNIDVGMITTSQGKLYPAGSAAVQNTTCPARYIFDNLKGNAGMRRAVMQVDCMATGSVTITMSTSQGPGTGIRQSTATLNVNPNCRAEACLAGSAAVVNVARTRSGRNLRATVNAAAARRAPRTPAKAATTDTTGATTDMIADSGSSSVSYAPFVPAPPALPVFGPPTAPAPSFTTALIPNRTTLVKAPTPPAETQYTSQVVGPPAVPENFFTPSWRPQMPNVAAPFGRSVVPVGDAVEGAAAAVAGPPGSDPLSQGLGWLMIMGQQFGAQLASQASGGRNPAMGTSGVPGGLGSAFPGQSNGFPGQTTAFPGQSSGFAGQTTAFPGQSTGYGSQLPPQMLAQMQGTDPSSAPLGLSNGLNQVYGNMPTGQAVTQTKSSSVAPTPVTPYSGQQSQTTKTPTPNPQAAYADWASQAVNDMRTQLNSFINSPPAGGNTVKANPSAVSQQQPAASWPPESATAANAPPASPSNAVPMDPSAYKPVIMMQNGQMTSLVESPQPVKKNSTADAALSQDLANWLLTQNNLIANTKKPAAAPVKTPTPTPAKTPTPAPSAVKPPATKPTSSSLDQQLVAKLLGTGTAKTASQTGTGTVETASQTGTGTVKTASQTMSQWQTRLTVPPKPTVKAVAVPKCVKKVANKGQCGGSSSCPSGVKNCKATWTGYCCPAKHKCVSTSSSLKYFQCKPVA
eukprot:jgi/Chrzof1/2984/Cz12g07010.t1